MTASRCIFSFIGRCNAKHVAVECEQTGSPGPGEGKRVGVRDGVCDLCLCSVLVINYFLTCARG